MEALGRLFDIVAVADDVYVNMKNASAVTFVGVLAAGETYTLTEATTAAGGGAQALSAITRSHVQTTGAGADTWTLLTQAAASTEVASSAQDVCVIHVSADQMSAGYDYLKLASTSTGTVMAILHDLKVQRKPTNLAAAGV